MVNSRFISSDGGATRRTDRAGEGTGSSYHDLRSQARAIGVRTPIARWWRSLISATCEADVGDFGEWKEAHQWLWTNGEYDIYLLSCDGSGKLGQKLCLYRTAYHQDAGLYIGCPTPASTSGSRGW